MIHLDTPIGLASGMPGTSWTTPPRGPSSPAPPAGSQPRTAGGCCQVLRIGRGYTWGLSRHQSCQAGKMSANVSVDWEESLEKVYDIVVSVEIRTIPKLTMFFLFDLFRPGGLHMDISSTMGTLCCGWGLVWLVLRRLSGLVGRSCSDASQSVGGAKLTMLRSTPFLCCHICQKLS
jgi:hypothetical protein